jgi:hypothetical protein
MKYFAIAILLLGSCQRNGHQLSVREYIQWIDEEENQLTVEKKIDNYYFQLFYKPHEFIVLKDLNEKQADNTQLAEKLKSLAGTQYFSLRVENLMPGAKDLLNGIAVTELDYQQKLEYCNSYLSADIKLIDGNDTLPCVLYHFERNYGVAPFNVINLAFENKNIHADKPNDKCLVYDDKLFGTGPVLLTIKAETLANLPTLLIN